MNSGLTFMKPINAVLQPVNTFSEC